jgi:leucyl aminopeptidase
VAPTLQLISSDGGTVTGAIAEAAAFAVATVPGDEGAVLSPLPRSVLGDLAGLDLPAVLTRENAKGKAGEVVSVPSGDKLVLLVGVGDGTPTDFRRAGAALARRARSAETLVTTVARGADAAGLRAFAEGLLLGSYSFSVASSPKPSPLRSVSIAADRPDARAEALRVGVVTARAAMVARDLASMPSREKTPAWLARRAVTLTRNCGVTARALDEKDLAAAGFGGVLAVGMGSTRPPRFIELDYTPERPTGHVVLVGKGITFDSGGLSLKPNEGMVAMKTDMSGGGAVIAVMTALADLGVSVRVTGLIPAAENLPSGSAQRPGDVITHYGGTTVEVLNTDAEGRLVLADALAYAATELKPDVIVDLATLTGAATLGLGRRHAAMYSTDDRLARALEAAADASGERVWRMPLVEDYLDALDSDVADLCHIDRTNGRGGGSITAALFLREFTGGHRWAHLDIAGPARADADEYEITKGPTGYGVRLLLHWLASRSPLR